MRKIRLLIHNTGTVVGGIERCLYLLLKHLDRNAFEPTLAHESAERLEPWLKQIRDLDIPCFPISLNRLSHIHRIPFFAHWMKKQRFDVLHANLDQRYSTLAAWMAQVPGVVWSYHVRIPNLKPYQHWMNRTSLRLARGKCIAVSEAIKSHLLESGYEEKDLTVVVYGIEPIGIPPGSFDRAAYRASLGVAPNDVMALNLARLSEQKGHKYLFEALASLRKEATFPNLKCVLAGDGPLQESLEQQVSDMGLSEQLTFLGFRKDVTELLWACDFLVLPSLWEGLPLVLLEALSAGKPCIATEVDGSAEAVQDGKTGIVVPARDPKSLADAIVRLVQNEGQTRQFGDNALQLFEDRFHIKAHIERVQSVYLEQYARGMRRNG